MRNLIEFDVVDFRVENSVPPRIPYVVKRQVEIESSMTVLNQQQSSVLIARAATD